MRNRRKELLETVKKEQEKEGALFKVISRSSLDEELLEEISEIDTMLEFLEIYGGDHPMLRRMADKSRRTPSWVPSQRDRNMFFAILRNLRKDKRGNKLSGNQPPETLWELPHDLGGKTSLD